MLQGKSSELFLLSSCKELVTLHASVCICRNVCVQCNLSVHLTVCVYDYTIHLVKCCTSLYIDIEINYSM